MHRMTPSISSSAEIMITGTCFISPFAFICLSTANPSSSGMMTSSRTKSGRSRAISSNACLPLIATLIW